MNPDSLVQRNDREEKKKIIKPFISKALGCKIEAKYY